MGLFERWLGPKPSESASAPRRIEIPQDRQAREKLFGDYGWPLELLMLQEKKANLDDYGIVIHPEVQCKIDNLRDNPALRAAVKAYQEDQKRQTSQRMVA